MLAQLNGALGQARAPRLSRPVLFVLLVSLGAADAGIASSQDQGRLRPAADRVPSFRLASTPGGREIGFPDRGSARTLVSFISLRASQPTDSASRGEIAILESLRHQTRPHALQIVVVAYAGTGRPASASEATNAWFDWRLGPIPLLVDRSGEVARAYGVRRAPATFLLTARGRIIEHWGSFVAPGPLDLAAEGAPH